MGETENTRKKECCAMQLRIYNELAAGGFSYAEINEILKEVNKTIKLAINKEILKIGSIE